MTKLGCQVDMFVNRLFLSNKICKLLSVTYEAFCSNKSNVF